MKLPRTVGLAVAVSSEKKTATPMTNDQSDKPSHPSRRGFLGVAAATGAASLAPGALIATTAALAEASEPASSQSVDASASTNAARLPSPVPGYATESARLLGVLDERLAGRDWVMGADYSIADISLLGCGTRPEWYRAGPPLPPRPEPCGPSDGRSRRAWLARHPRASVDLSTGT
jgi:glutathione S-transferase